MAEQKSKPQVNRTKETNVVPVQKMEAGAEKKVEEVSEEKKEAQITEIIPEGKVAVKNIFKRNIHTIEGKICAGETGYVTISEAKDEADKDPEDRRFLEI